MSFHLSLNTEPVTAAYPNEPLLVSPDTEVGDVLQLLQAHRAGSVLICEETSLLGIFTERDAMRWMTSGESKHVAIEAVMSHDPQTISHTATVGDAIRLMSEGGYRRLPILSADGKPIGVAAVNGIVHYLVDHFPQTIYTLPPKPGSLTSEREGA